MQLRDYQDEAVSALYQWFAEQDGNPLVVAPTGSGKSLILAEFIRRAISDYPETRVICATHVKELLGQNCATLKRLWPDAPAGVYSAGLGRREMRQITFAGIQSVAKKARDFGFVDLLIVDEAHLIPRAGATQYRNFIDGLKLANPALKVVGLTATPYRLDSGRLDDGDGAIFGGVAYDIPVAMLVQRGYLAPLISKRPKAAFDTKGLHTRAGEFIEVEMDARFNTQETTRTAVREVVSLGQERRSWLLFCISVDHAKNIRDELRQTHGISAEMVTGQTPAPDRARILEAFKAGHIRAITNVNVLTTGFDAPATDLLVFLRPTKSLALYIQMAGRAMRTAPGKDDALVLDFAGNVMRHGPVDAVHGPKKKGEQGEKEEKEQGEIPAKLCPNCDEICSIAVKECPCCGYLFPPTSTPPIESEASTAPIMNLTARVEWLHVQDFAVSKHVKAGSPPSMRAEYLVAGKLIRDWICLEHTGYARQKAVRWWEEHAGTEAPASIDEALERADEIVPPLAVTVIRKDGYDRIGRQTWSEQEILRAAS